MNRPIPMHRRTTLACLALAALATMGTAARADDTGNWPNRTITLLVPYAAGGNVDVMARWVAPGLGQRLGQQVVVENVSGAGGVIGTEKAARAKPDGYTWLLSVESTIVIAKMVTPSVVRYDGLKDLQPVTLLGAQPLALVGKPALAPQTAAELFKDMKAAPGKYSYATSGVGTSLHLGGEWLKQKGGVDFVHVPYRAGAQIVTDLAGNQLDLAVLPVSMVLQQVRAGKMRAFGVLDAKPSAALPQAPALGSVEPAWKGVDVTVWQGVFAPQGTPAAMVAKVDAALREVLADPAVRKNFEDSGVTAIGMGPAEFGRFLKGEQDKFSAIVTTGNIKAE